MHDKNGCNTHGMQRYMVGTFELGWKCDDQLSVRDKVRNIGKNMQNVTNLGSVVTCMENVTGTSHVCLKCVWWKHAR